MNEETNFLELLNSQLGNCRPTIIVGESPFGNKSKKEIDNNVVSYEDDLNGLGIVAFWRNELTTDQALVRILFLLIGASNTRKLFSEYKNESTDEIIKVFTLNNIYFVNIYKELSCTNNNLNFEVLEVLKRLNSKYSILLCSKPNETKKSKQFMKQLKSLGKIYKIIHPSARGIFNQKVAEMWDLGLYSGDEWDKSDDIINQFQLVKS